VEPGKRFMWCDNLPPRAARLSSPGGLYYGARMKKTWVPLMGSISDYVGVIEQTCEIVAKDSKMDKEKFVTLSMCDGFHLPIEWISKPT
jgi:hypothetical protein